MRALEKQREREESETEMRARERQLIVATIYPSGTPTHQT
jgi:hypothetical protein